MLFALERAPAALARSLLDDVVEGDARLAWLGTRVGLDRPPHADIPLEDAELVVFDLETTGLSASRCRICEIGAVRVRALEIEDTFETLVNPGAALPSYVAALTGIRDADLQERAARGAGRPPLPRLRGRRAARRAQRALRPRVPRARGRAAHRPARRGARHRHRLARAAAPSAPERALLARLARALLRDVDQSVPPSASGCARDRGDPDLAARSRAGARARGRSRTSSSSPRPARASSTRSGR